MIDRHTAVTRAYTIPGQTWPQELGWIYDRFSGSRRHAEIGVFCGRSLFAAAAGMPAGAEVYAVDSQVYEDMPGFSAPDAQWVDRVCAATLAALPADITITQLLKPSIDAARLLAALGLQFDSVYIDGSHHFADVAADIACWRMLVRPGGLMAGHDFWAACPGVMDAVHEAFPAGFNVLPNARIWSAVVG